jgi:hypothetical protein
VHVIFLIPGRGDTLRSTGARGWSPTRRSSTRWSSAATGRCWLSTWDPTAIVPRRAVLSQQLERPESSLEELDEYYGPSYETKIYE